MQGVRKLLVFTSIFHRAMILAKPVSVSFVSGSIKYIRTLEGLCKDKEREEPESIEAGVGIP